MEIYILNLLMMGVYSIVYNISKLYIKNKHLLKFFVSLVIVQLVLILSLRHVSIGRDLGGYISYFKSMPNYHSLNSLLLSNRFEVGYKLLNKIISILTANEQILLSIIAIVSIVPIGRIIYKYSKMAFLSFALYVSMDYYFFTFSGLRQAIAFGICFSSYEYIRQKKFIKFLLSIFLGSLFHKSALIFMPAYFIADLKLNKLNISFILLVDIIVFLFRRPIFIGLKDLFYNTYDIIETTSYEWMMLCFLILLFGLPLYKYVNTVSETNSNLYVFLIVGVSLMIFASVGNNVMRVANYYYMFVILFIPEVMHSLKDRRLVLLGGYSLIFFIFVLSLWFLKVDGYDIVPYSFFWR